MKKIAFAGLRHDHITMLYNETVKSPELEICAVCEEDAAARQTFLKLHGENRAPVYDSLEKMLAEVPCDIVATGDYYGKRGSVVLRALEAGRHVIADKPLCTSLAELDAIEKAAREKHLAVGLMLDLRTNPQFVQARKMVLSGELGKIVQIQFNGQHPLLPTSRPHWYFEPGKHGGTINDIAIHAIDYVPWLTGQEIRSFTAARTWQAFDSSCDCFNDAAQFMFVLENGCGVLGDVSYSEPDSHGYKMPQYWRFTVWGTRGVLE
ncbi:MAG: Gfo/Idh/MocA family oxidoreductase, partial [Clostridia bacterium]|nr:Gfo/Idh/MocA family oxidoreductase [Clostridia bacterium]